MPTAGSTPPTAGLWSLCGQEQTSLGHVLLTYRAATGLTQARLGDLLGFAQGYICRLERGERSIRDIDQLRRIAAVLAIPPRVLGVTDPDRDPPISLELARPALRLAVVARRAGQPAAAAREFWPLMATLEAEAPHRGDPEFLRLLVEARVTFATTLGHVLPAEQLDTVTGWTTRALQVARMLEDSGLTASVLRMHGNETRKAGRPHPAIPHLREAVARTEDDPARQGAALALLGRAASEAGHAGLYDQAVTRATRLIEATGERDPLFNPYVLGEVQLRGAVRLGRTSQVADLLGRQPADDVLPPGPQWQVLRQITLGEALLAVGDPSTALAEFEQALPTAAAGHLPQQLQRITQALAPHRASAEARALAGSANRRLTELTQHTQFLPASAGSQPGRAP